MTAPTASGAATSTAIASEFLRTFVVDDARRVLESTCAELPVGTELAGAPWLGEASLEALRDADAAGRRVRRAASDFTRGASFVLEAEVTSRAPWRGTVRVVDASLAVAGDRAAVLGTLVHAMQNVSFALQSVLEAIELDHPTGDALDEYLAHLRMPADKLSATMTRLTACLHPPTPTLAPVGVDAVVDLAVERVAREKRPERIVGVDSATVLEADRELLAEVVAAMLESGAENVVASLHVDAVDVGGAPHVLIAVERAGSPTELRAVTGLWDIAGGHRLDVPLRLTFARAIVLAHGGDVVAEALGGGRVRIGIRVPRATAA